MLLLRYKHYNYGKILNYFTAYSDKFYIMKPKIIDFLYTNFKNTLDAFLNP